MGPTGQGLRLLVRYRLLYPLLARLPAGVAYRIASAAGRWGARLDRGRLATACAALERVFPQWSPSQRRGVVLSQHGLLAREILDVYRLRRLRADNVDALVRLHGVDHLERAVATGRPVILYSAHFGRLIMPAMALGLKGVTTSCLTADVDHPRTPAPERRYLAFKLAEMQRLMGGEMIQRGAPLRRLYRVLHRKGVLIVMLDAPPAKADAVEQFGFLGGTARLAVGTLRLARRTGAVLVPYFALERGATIEGRVLPAIDIRGLDDRAALGRLFAPIERHVRAHPDHWWLWPILPAIWRPRVAPPLEARRRAPELA